MKRHVPSSRLRVRRSVPDDRVELHLVLVAQGDELRSLLGPAIRLEVGALPVAGMAVSPDRRSAIVDLLRHLALDARDAMPAGGVLRILAGSLQVAGATPARCAALVCREIGDAAARGSPGRGRKGRSLGLGAACDFIEGTGGHLLVSCDGREIVTTICFPPAP